MRITRIDCQLLKVPLSRPRASLDEAAAGRLNHVSVLLVRLDVDDGPTRPRFRLHPPGQRPRPRTPSPWTTFRLCFRGKTPLDHERLGVKVYWALQTVGRRGLVQQAYSAFDVALWDLKAKAANLPLYKLLGGARESAPVYGSDTAWLWMSTDQIVEASRPYLDQGMMGIKVKVGADPEADADRLTALREAFGDDVWLAVDANERYDYGTALAMGRFFEEEIGADWFEEPISCEDVEGHARLASKLDVPIAAGEMLFGRDEFAAYLGRGALDVVQPDVTRARRHYRMAEDRRRWRSSTIGRCRRTCCRRSASIWRAACRRWRRSSTCRGCTRCSRRRRGSRRAGSSRRRVRDWAWKSIRRRRRNTTSRRDKPSHKKVFPLPGRRDKKKRVNRRARGGSVFPFPAAPVRGKSFRVILP